MWSQLVRSISIQFSLLHPVLIHTHTYTLTYIDTYIYIYIYITFVLQQYHEDQIKRKLPVFIKKIREPCQTVQNTNSFHQYVMSACQVQFHTILTVTPCTHPHTHTHTHTHIYTYIHTIYIYIAFVLQQYHEDQIERKLPVFIQKIREPYQTVPKLLTAKF